MGRSLALRLAPLALVTAALAATANACGSDATAAGTPPPLATGEPPPREAGTSPEAAAPVDASTSETGAPARSFTGTLAATKPAAFGGGSFCNYRLTMKSVEVSVNATATGEITNATVTSLAVEETVPPCTYTPVPPNIHKYYLASSSKLPGGGSHLELAMDPLNRTEATLVLEGDFSTDALDAALEWHRTDQKAPLDWRVTTTVPLVHR